MKPALILLSALMYAGSASGQNVNSFIPENINIAPHTTINMLAGPVVVHSPLAREPGQAAINAAANQARSADVGVGESILFQLEAQQTLSAQLPSPVINHMPADFIITAQDKNRHTITVTDPKSHLGRIIDLSTGQMVGLFDPEVGLTGALPSGVTTDSNGSVTIKGYSRNIVRNVMTSLATSEKIVARGSTTEINFNGKNSFQFRDSATFRDNSGVDRQHVIVQDRTYSYVYYNVEGASELVPVFRPFWWGNPTEMAAAWSAYTPFFAASSPWWRDGKFVKWAPPFTCSYNPFTSDDCWHQRYSTWGWSWNSDPFYNGYYLPRGFYSSVGDFLVDYRLQQELENDRLKRRAVYDNGPYDEAGATVFSANLTVLNSINVPMTELMRVQLVGQTEDIISAIQKGLQLYASDLFWCDNSGLNDLVHCTGHTFTVDSVYSENAAKGDSIYSCNLTPGDFIERDGSVPLVTQLSHNPDGTSQIDGDGNPVLITYVPMKVKASKQQSCQVGETVMVQATSLQNMLSEEIARTEEGIEKVVRLGIFPH